MECGACPRESPIVCTIHAVEVCHFTKTVYQCTPKVLCKVNSWIFKFALIKIWIVLARG